MTLHPVHRVAFLVTSEEKEAKNFMTLKLFISPSDDKKHYHSEKYNLFEEQEELIIDGKQN